MIKILIVDDDPDILDVIENTLKDDYKIITATLGKEALDKIQTESPDLVILDYVLPDITGIEICQEIRKNPLLIHIPILMLTGKGEVENKIEGLEAGADDYMVKPFLPQELSARVRMLLRRSSIHLDANPLTRLPGNISIYKELEEMLKNGTSFAVLYIDLDNFKALNDYYGFERGDYVIKEVGRLIIDVVQKTGSPDDFIGHIGGDDFIVITKPEKAENIAKMIINNFDSLRLKFYDEKDRVKGYIETSDRQGEIKKFGLLTISIGIITNLKTKYKHVAEITSKAAEVKSIAKSFKENKFIIEE